MAVGDTTSELPQALSRYYDKLLIDREKKILRLVQFAQKRPMPSHSGTSAYFTGYRPLEKPSSALTEGSSATAQSFAARQLSATVAEWGQTVRMSSLLDLTKIDPGLEEQVDIVATAAAETLDYQLSKLIAKQGVWGISAGMVASNHQTVIVSNDSSSNSGSAFRSTAATSLNAYSGSVTYTGAIVTVIKDGLTADESTVKYGWAGRVSSVSFAAATGDLWTVSTAAPAVEAPEDFQSSDRVRICAISNISANSREMSNSSFAMAQRDLIGNHAVRLMGGYYGAVVPSAILYSMKLDSTWVAAAQYSNITELYDGEVGRWYGFRVLETTQPYREDADGTEDESDGLLYHSFFVGKNAFGHTDLAGDTRKIHVVRGPDTNEPIPRNTYVSWKHTFAQKALTAPWAVDLVAVAAS